MNCLARIGAIGICGCVSVCSYYILRGIPIIEPLKIADEETQNKMNKLVKKMGIRPVRLYYADYVGMAFGCNMSWSKPSIVMKKYDSFIALHELAHIKFNHYLKSFSYLLGLAGSILLLPHKIFVSIVGVIVYFYQIKNHERDADIDAIKYADSTDIGNFITILVSDLDMQLWVRNSEQNFVTTMYNKIKYDSLGNHRFDTHPSHTERIKYLKAGLYEKSMIPLEFYIQRKDGTMEKIDVNSDLNRTIRNKIRYSKKETTLINITKIILKPHLDKYQIEVYSGADLTTYYDFKDSMDILKIIDSILEQQMVYCYIQGVYLDIDIMEIAKEIIKTSPSWIYDGTVVLDNNIVLIFKLY
uniref:Peptidase family M48 n=1 Tax=Marseillevirus LCMAC201 TaxID=2506605 RepID=A0A481YVQ1_9VIRU|nr:MAG: peptidase family M48 [Marseillevirus LCMAC201]